MSETRCEPGWKAAGRRGGEGTWRVPFNTCARIKRGDSVRYLIFATALATLPLSAHALDLAGLPPALAEKVSVARQACANVENGEFALEWGAVTRTDLDGDLQLDWVLDESAYACSTAVSLFCSTGGCMSHFLVGDVVASFRNQGWTVLTFGPNRVVVTRVHGSDCGGNSPAPCFAARAWDQDAEVWRSVAAGSD
jgi:hypothetical protein